MVFKPFQCQDCGSSVGFRSRPRTLTEKYVLPVLLLRPVRCADCFRRYYRTVFIEVREREPVLPHRAAA
jgi:hypothetical protein